MNERWPAGVKLGVWLQIGDKTYEVTRVVTDNRKGTPLHITYGLEGRGSGGKLEVRVNMKIVEAKELLNG